MKKWLLLLLLVPMAAFASNPARFDLPVVTTTPAQVPVGSLPSLLAVTNATVNVCGYPAVVVNGMCTNTITTYTDSSLGTACPPTAQLTAPGTAVCISTTGLQGTFGFWYDAAAQTHMTYTVQTSWGTYGPYDIAPGSSSGGGSGTVTSVSAGNLSALFSTSVANPGTTPALSFTPTNFAAHTFYGNNGGTTASPSGSLIGASDWSVNSFVAGGGSAQLQTVTLTPAPPALVAGLEVRWLPVAANTATAPTLDVNGLGAKAITKLGTTGLVAGDLTTTAVADAIYDGTRWQLQNPQTFTGAGVTAINSTVGAMTFTGSGVSQTGNTFTFNGGTQTSSQIVAALNTSPVSTTALVPQLIPAASNTILGGVICDGLTIDCGSSGVVKVVPNLSLQSLTATTSVTTPSLIDSGIASGAIVASGGTGPQTAATSAQIAAAANLNPTTQFVYALLPIGVSIASYHSSVLPVTYGTTTSGSNTVTVVDPSSWVTGEGVMIPATSDTSGGVPTQALICDNVTVSGNTLTLLNAGGTACNASWPSGTNAVPILHYDMTHGAITTGTNSLTVTSAATFSNGQGIRVAGAGAAGADLICPVIGVSGTTITLYQTDGVTACDAGTTVTAAQIFHDDTFALKNALAAGTYVRIPTGAYYLSSEVDISHGTTLYGDGALQSIFVSSQNAINTMVVKSSGITLRDLSIMQSPNYTPTSGVLLSLCDGTDACVTDNLSRLYLYGGWDQFEVQNKAIQDNVSQSTFYVPVHTAVHYSNPTPYGDVNFIDDEIDGCSTAAHCTTATGVLIDAGDTTNWANLKINSMAQQININAAVGTVGRQRFNNLSSEGGGNASGSYDITIVPSGSNAISEIQFTGGEFETSDASGVSLMDVGNAVTTFQMTGAQVLCNALSPSATAHGLDIAGQNATVTGNTITTCGDAVRLESTATATVSGNTLTGNLGWGIDAVGSPAPIKETGNIYSNNAAGNQNVPSYQSVDNFAGAASTALTTHYADTGQSWTAYTIDGDTGTLTLVGNGQVQANTNTADAYSSLVPSSANYTVTANCTAVTSLAICATMGRMSTSVWTLYEAIYIGGTGFQLYKVVNGTPTQLGSTYVVTFTIGTPYTIGLVMNGSTISGTINGVTEVTATDNAITAAGVAGFKETVTNNTMGNFRVANNSGLVTQPATQEYVQDSIANLNTGALTATSATFNGTSAVTQLTAATSSANANSPSMVFQGNYWNGSASVADAWTCFDDLSGWTGSPTNPPSNLTCNHTGSSGLASFKVPDIIVANLNATVNATFNSAGANALSVNNGTFATSGANQSSPLFVISGNYWTGSANSQDWFSLEDILGAGSNPSATLTLAHSGTTGAKSVDLSAANGVKLPNYTVAGLPSAPAVGTVVVVTDASSFTPGPCAGGGSDVELAISSGSAWVCQ